MRRFGGISGYEKSVWRMYRLGMSKDAGLMTVSREGRLYCGLSYCRN